MPAPIIDPWGGPPPADTVPTTPAHDGFTAADLARICEATSNDEPVTVTWPGTPLYDCDGLPAGMTEPSTAFWWPTTKEKADE